MKAAVNILLHRLISAAAPFRKTPLPGLLSSQTLLDSLIISSSGQVEQCQSRPDGRFPTQKAACHAVSCLAAAFLYALDEFRMALLAGDLNFPPALGRPQTQPTVRALEIPVQLPVAKTGSLERKPLGNRAPYPEKHLIFPLAGRQIPGKHPEKHPDIDGVGQENQRPKEIGKQHLPVCGVKKSNKEADGGIGIQAKTD